MFTSQKPETASVRLDYAKPVDFCEAFERDMKPFYLLAFLMTANHKEAERCFAATVEESCEENSVFTAWMNSWIKRYLIKRAVRIVLSRPARSDDERNLWCQGPAETRISDVVNAVTKLEALERFVFVMSILEGYSARECSLLLDCTTESVAQLRVRASCRLAISDPFFTRDLAGLSDRVKSA
ncbi:MAG TPA: hypothetical protein VIX14_15900 [Terriglobales bacterium]